MLTRLDIESFKAFGERQTATLAPMTLIFGTNSSGKSALLQSLLFLKQSVEGGRPLYAGPHVDLASVNHVVFRHDESLQPSVAIAFQERWSSLNEMAVGLKVSTSKTFELDLSVNGSPGFRLTYDGLGAKLLDKNAHAGFLAFVRSANPQWSAARYSRFANVVDQLESFLFEFGLRPPRLFPAITPDLDLLTTMWDDYDPEENEDWEDIFKLSEDDLNILIDDFTECRTDVVRSWDRIVSSYSYQLLRLKHFGPVRPAPIRQLLRDCDSTTSALRALNDTSQEALEKWCAYLGLPYQFTADALGDVATGHAATTRVTDHRNKLTLALTDVGYGVSQVLPLLLEGVHGCGINLVEQPELHLHPRQQGHLADFFLWSSGLCGDFGKSISVPNNSLPAQWILETHSEALVSRIQRRIRQGRVDPTQVSVMFVEPGPEGSRLIPLRLNPSGEFVDEWPGGFFEETYWDLFGGVQ